MSPMRVPAPSQGHPLLNPRMRSVLGYPFSRLESIRERLRARGVEPIDLSLGDPREVTPEFIRQALRDAVPECSAYPTVLGRASLRGAISAWFSRRYGKFLDPDRHILPASGSKEAIFHLALLLVHPDGPRRRVVYPTPAYPVYELGALLAGGEPTPIPALPEHGWLPDLDAVPASTWRETAILWLNYPHNPTGAVAPLEFYKKAAQLALRHSFVVASDEAYAEIYFDEPPPSLLQAGFARSIVFHSLSKRSAMTGFRSGFVAGDPVVIEGYRKLRPSLGVASPEFVQAAAEAAWEDEEHVERMRRDFRTRRDLFYEFLRSKGLDVFRPGGTFFLWVRAPDGDDEAFSERWFEAGVLVLPGSWLGAGGAGYLRVALVAGLEGCLEATRRLEPIL